MSNESTHNLRKLGNIRKTEAATRGALCEKAFLENSPNSQGKHLCQSLFNKATGLRPKSPLEKRLWYRCFSVNFVKFLRTPFLQNTSGSCFWRWTSWYLQNLCVDFSMVYFFCNRWCNYVYMIGELMQIMTKIYFKH